MKILSFRFAKLFSKLAKNRVEAIKRHIKEEGENIKILLAEEKGMKNFALK